MSEPIAGLPPAPKPGKPRDAASVVLFRRAGDGVEVFWIRREKSLSFAGGFFAFPGGAVDPADANIPLDGSPGAEQALRVAAVRELFEEVGVLLADGAEALDDEQRTLARHDLVDGHKGFAQLLSELKLKLRGADLRDGGRWITPPFMPKRFDARFFLAELPRGQSAVIWEGEASEGAWIRPQDALARWENGSALLHPPALHVLQVLTEFKTTETAAARMTQAPHAPGFVPTRIEFQRGIRMFPLETPTLPPATHTNCYVIGTGELLIVDPGSADVRQCARLLALIAGLKSEGKLPKAVLLTHHHSDHIGGAATVMERLGIPLWCHAKTADRLSLPVERILEDGEVISLTGLPTMKLTVLHTPGHARGHVCLIDEASKAAIVGDMVAGIGTILIDPPEGDMTDYLAQLGRLRDLPVGTLYPSHGPPIPEGPAKLAEYLRHREQREGRVLAAIMTHGVTLPDIVPIAYSDTPKEIFPLAERSTQAILIKLVRDGKVLRQEDRYFPAPVTT